MEETEKAMAPHSSTLAWKIPWTEEPVGCSPWDCDESDMTDRLHFHFSLSGIGEGNGNPLQCSCLENPRDRGAWWAAVYGVAQSRTQLKRFSSSSSSKGIQLQTSGVHLLKISARSLKMSIVPERAELLHFQNAVFVIVIWKVIYLYFGVFLLLLAFTK